MATIEKKLQLLKNILRHRYESKFENLQTVKICSNVNDLRAFNILSDRNRKLAFEKYDFVCLVIFETWDGIRTNYFASGGQTEEECIRKALKEDAYIDIYDVP